MAARRPGAHRADIGTGRQRADRRGPGARGIPEPGRAAHRGRPGPAAGSGGGRRRCASPGPRWRQPPAPSPWAGFSRWPTPGTCRPSPSGWRTTPSARPPRPATAAPALARASAGPASPLGPPAGQASSPSGYGPGQGDRRIARRHPAGSPYRAGRPVPRRARRAAARLAAPASTVPASTVPASTVPASETPGQGTPGQPGTPGGSPTPGPTQQPSPWASSSPSAGAAPSPTASPSTSQQSRHQHERVPAATQSFPPDHPPPPAAAAGAVRQAGSQPPRGPGLPPSSLDRTPPVRRQPGSAQVRPGTGQRRKSTEVVFAPLITTATVSSRSGKNRPESSAASAAHPPGSATRRSRSQSSSWARTMSSSADQHHLPHVLTDHRERVLADPAGGQRVDGHAPRRTVHGAARPQGAGQGGGARRFHPDHPRLARVGRADAREQPATAHAGQYGADRGCLLPQLGAQRSRPQDRLDLVERGHRERARHRHPLLAGRQRLGVGGPADHQIRAVAADALDLGRGRDFRDEHAGAHPQRLGRVRHRRAVIAARGGRHPGAGHRAEQQVGERAPGLE